MTYGNIILGSLGVGAFIALLSVIGEEDYKAAIQEERNACLMVEAGHWPAGVAEGYDCPKRMAEALVKRIESTGASYE